MDKTIYTVTLADGTQISNLTMNGNNFISTEVIARSVFENNCSPVVISDGEKEETHSAMALIHLTEYERETWFALRDMSNSELEAIKNRSDIEYLALMCDVEL